MSFTNTPLNLTSAANMATEIADKVAKATEQSILQQLNDFISRGLIEVQQTVPQFVRSFDSDVVEIRQSVTLVLKDKEYIEKLEAKVKKFEEILTALTEVKNER
jgi:hypothetical protein